MNYIVSVLGIREKLQIYHVNLRKPYVQKAEVAYTVISQNYEGRKI